MQSESAISSKRRDARSYVYGHANRWACEYHVWRHLYNLYLGENKKRQKRRCEKDTYLAHAEKDYVDDEEIQIVRSKKFDIKPMYPEDACIQMELLGHNFFVFFNAETDQVNVVYKRKGNTYGIMEPDL